MVGMVSISRGCGRGGWVISKKGLGEWVCHAFLESVTALWLDGSGKCWLSRYPVYLKYAMKLHDSFIYIAYCILPFVFILILVFVFVFVFVFV